jgi:hypothetical protein
MGEPLAKGRGLELWVGILLGFYEGEPHPNPPLAKGRGLEGDEFLDRLNNLKLPTFLIVGLNPWKK